MFNNTNNPDNVSNANINVPIFQYNNESNTD